jgi:hypothetical protein
MSITRPKSLPLLAVTAGALVVGLALPTAAAQAAHLINGSSIKNHTITGKKLKANTLTGTQIKESTLRTVPEARRVAAGAIGSSSISAGGLSVASLAAWHTPVGFIGGTTIPANSCTIFAGQVIAAAHPSDTLVSKVVQTQGTTTLLPVGAEMDNWLIENDGGLELMSGVCNLLHSSSITLPATFDFRVYGYR